MLRGPRLFRDDSRLSASGTTSASSTLRHPVQLSALPFQLICPDYQSFTKKI